MLTLFEGPRIHWYWVGIMRLFQGLSPVLLLSCLLVAPLLGHAQTVSPNNNDLLLRGMAGLGDQASFHTDFTFDNPMLRELARGFPGDEESQRTLEHLQSVTVHVYRYSRPGLYNPGDVDLVRNFYRGPAWKHLVATSPNREPRPARTDLWIRYKQGNVEGMVLLVAQPKTLDMIEINGKLSPLDLLHLRGHFGIPRFSGERFSDDSGHHFLAEDR
jgi:hypothetical protein